MYPVLTRVAGALALPQASRRRGRRGGPPVQPARGLAGGLGAHRTELVGEAPDERVVDSESTRHLPATVPATEQVDQQRRPAETPRGQPSPLSGL